MHQQIEKLNELDSFPWLENYPQPIDTTAFQEELNHVAGLASDGKPIIRVVWAGKEEEVIYGRKLMKYEFIRPWKPVEFVFFDYEQGKQIKLPWYAANEAFSPEERRRLCLPEDLTPISHPKLFSWAEDSIGIQRFVLEQYHPPQEFSDWEDHRYEWKGLHVRDAEGPQKLDIYGDLDDSRLYQPLPRGADLVCLHDGRCCNGKGVRQLKNGSQRCYGMYKEPDDLEIKKIRAAIYYRNQEKQQRMPGEAPTEAERDAAGRMSWEAILERDAKGLERWKERFASFFSTHAHRLMTDDPSVLNHGIYHFQGGHSKSGMSAAERAKLGQEKKIILTDE